MPHDDATALGMLEKKKKKKKKKKEKKNYMKLSSQSS